MTFLNTLRSGVDSAVDAISNAAQAFVEKNRTSAKLNRLRSVMKSESELMNRAYIALGKGYYAQIKKGEKPNTEREQKLVELIDNCKAKIARARDCYRKIVESQNEYLFSTVSSNAAKETFEKQDVVDITVACSNESEYASSPFPKAPEKDAAQDAAGDDAPKEELF